ncbi:surface-adhesin E family protein [Comamonas thiooxydans]|uniref:surface-adhesin E family protein n=1 Tax=Comamonas thiooxydans TaxID=363952 RepID=UPI00118556E6|nr:surface-adhesin E family protein [Comamonas thiooxydans]
MRVIQIALATLLVASNAHAQNFFQGFADGLARGTATIRDAEDAKLRRQLREDLEYQRLERESNARQLNAQNNAQAWAQYSNLPATSLGQRYMTGDAASAAIVLGSAYRLPDQKSIRAFVVTDLPPKLVNQLQIASFLEQPTINCETGTITISGMTMFDQPGAAGKAVNHSSQVTALQSPHKQPFEKALFNQACQQMSALIYGDMLKITENELKSEGIDTKKHVADFDAAIREGAARAMKDGLEDSWLELKASATALVYAKEKMQRQYGAK